MPEIGLQYEILMDKRENPRKCTIHPLKQRPDFRLRYFSGNRPIPAFSADCLLHVNGEDLSQIPAGSFRSLGLIDCTWKKVPGVLQRLEKPLPRLVSFPAGFATAYPRRNQEGLDPGEGLATIEPLFIASAFLGFWDETLLEKYYFKQDFLTSNEGYWKKFRLGPYGN
jgi:pre-rRNA-processing protein TSR3